MSRVVSDFSGSCQKDVAPRYCSQVQAVLFNTNALSAHVISLLIERAASECSVVISSQVSSDLRCPASLALAAFFKCEL